jgi:uncharacterized protein (TIGR02145 family)
MQFTVNHPNLQLVSATLQGNGQMNLKVKFVGTPAPLPVNSFLNYSYSDEYTSFSGKLPLQVAAVSPCDDTTTPYPTVTIGGQVWMQKNLNICKYRNGDDIPQVQDPIAWVDLTTGAWCYYQNNTANGPIYGKLYNGYAVNDPRGLAPLGYHVPSDDEWNTLVTFLGGESVAGGEMKATTGWTPRPGITNTNSSGFTGLPGGGRTNFLYGEFYFVGEKGTWWSSSNYFNIGVPSSFTRTLNFNDATAYQGGNYMLNGLSVRCIKD